jgi:segregation and condensation protein B
MDLETKIEAVLFYKAEPMKRSALAALFEVSDDELREALSKLQSRLQSGATRIIQTDTVIRLSTAPELAPFIEQLRKDEMKRDIGKAGAETLAIVLYRGPLSRIEIDRIRGVNSTFILRNLLVRGLVERREHPTDQRSFLYAGTPALLGHLGITNREELPDFENIMNELDTFEKKKEMMPQDS